MAYNKRKREEAFSDYQVFINHRGPDTKKTVASLLYQHLHSLGLRVFLDREELNTGDCVSPVIKAAIETSSIHIVIFSPTYAQSQWCLEELCWMLQECHTTTIIPIFWDVEPSDLKRVEEGQYAEAFKKHKGRGRMEVEKWEEALGRAADIKGHVFHTGEGDWGKFVNVIVEIVRKEVRREPLVVAEHPVGLDRAAKKLYNKILKQMAAKADTTIVGIAGLGGSGKTTLVTHLYNLEHSKFKRFSFLCEVSESKLTSLQEQLLFDLLGCHQLHIGNKMEGRRLLRERLKGLSQVLIVLDGINHQEQIDSLLLPVKDVLVDSSLIVITACDKDLLARCEVSFLYNMKLLDEKDAGKLFCYHAFRTSEAPTGFEDLVRELVITCGGHPLALKVLGAQFFGKQKRYWKLQLKILQEKQFPNEIVQNIVKATYDSLEEEAKVVFLEVASFFEGLDIHLVVRVHGEVECPLLDWIETLGQKCLVEFRCVEADVHDGYHVDLNLPPYRVCKIGMHRLVKDMAKKIASQELSLCLSCSENQMISSGYEISDWLPVVIVDRDGIQKTGQLKNLVMARYREISGIYDDSSKMYADSIKMWKKYDHSMEMKKMHAAYMYNMQELNSDLSSSVSASHSTSVSASHSPSVSASHSTDILEEIRKARARKSTARKAKALTDLSCMDENVSRDEMGRAGIIRKIEKSVDLFLERSYLHPNFSGLQISDKQRQFIAFLKVMRH